MAFQPQSNGHQDSTLKNVHCTKHQWLGNEDDYITNEEINHNQWRAPNSLRGSNVSPK
jgi:hypothetical protein